MDVDGEGGVGSLQAALRISTWMVFGVCKVQNVLWLLVSMQGVEVDDEFSRRGICRM